mgnify:CR=1 FL=1
MICLFFNSSNIIKQMCKRKIILIMNSCIREEVRSDFITRVHTSVIISQCTLVIIKFALWRCLVTTFEQWKFSKFSRSSLKQLSKHFRSLHVEFNSEWERERLSSTISRWWATIEKIQPGGRDVSLDFEYFCQLSNRWF